MRNRNKGGVLQEEGMAMICFHNPDEENGYLSNWFLSEFTVDGITFSSMEQYMMYEKAVLFKDQTTAEKILQADDVAKIKALGRTVQNFDDKVWTKEREGIVYRGVSEKFCQNPELSEKLEKTGKEIIAECAVKDRIWGIGLSMKDEDRLSIDKWRGQNLLGKILMRVREDIRHQNKVNQACLNVEKACSGSAEAAGFHTESELQDYAMKNRQEKENK